MVWGQCAVQGGEFTGKAVWQTPGFRMIGFDSQETTVAVGKMTRQRLYRVTTRFQLGLSDLVCLGRVDQDGLRLCRQKGQPLDGPGNGTLPTPTVSMGVERPWRYLPGLVFTRRIVPPQAIAIYQDYDTQTPMVIAV